MRLLLSTLTLLLLVQATVLAQRKVAITIDDVPNTRLYKQKQFESKLMQQLDSLSIPIAIFINEGLIYKPDAIDENFILLHDWFQRDYITLGNHTFTHPRYSKVGFDEFKANIMKGDDISIELAKIYDKPLHHFRFPYNDLGKDSVQHVSMEHLLDSLGYAITPFTIESMDWMFNYVYETYLRQGDISKANYIGQQYVTTTIAFFDFFEQLSEKLYGRAVSHIYLCHDNQINADFLGNIMQQLEEKQYEFISLDEALTDPIYEQADEYYDHRGISWIYRWMDHQEDRVKWMRQESNTEEIESLYAEMVSKNK
ncbi:MAG: polysaccharide deacetylase family protein [Bacteroidota bacterium]